MQQDEAAEEQQAMTTSEAILNPRPRTTTATTKRRKDREETDNFLKMYNGLNQLEKQTNKKISTISLEAKGKKLEKNSRKGFF